MSSFKLQTVLGQLSDLTPAELSEVKGAIDAELTRHLRTIGANGDLTEEEWESLESNIVSCVKMVRDRLGLSLRDSKTYVDRARAKGRPRTQGLTSSSGSFLPSAPILPDCSGRDSKGHTLYCPRGCCDTGQDFGKR